MCKGLFAGGNSFPFFGPFPTLKAVVCCNKSSRAKRRLRGFSIFPSGVFFFCLIVPLFRVPYSSNSSSFLYYVFIQPIVFPPLRSFFIIVVLCQYTQHNIMMENG
ncbi:hypothetical protein GPALN_010426 [Globodera pallida]|nr:hypothetical protein GPALN_010426 [Globodera pallida]